MSEPKLTRSDLRRLRREAGCLIAKGEMPSLDEVFQAVAAVREKYRPKILAARAKANEEAATRRAQIHGLGQAAKQIAAEEKLKGGRKAKQ